MSALGRNQTIHGERRPEHAPVTRKGINATVFLLLALFCVACWYSVGWVLVWLLGGVR